MENDKLDSLHWPLAPWFPSWTYLILIVNGVILLALHVAATVAARRGDAARVRLYRVLIKGSLLVTIGGNLIWLLTFAVPGSVVASAAGDIFTAGSLVPLLVWAVPPIVLIDLVRRRHRSR